MRFDELDLSPEVQKALREMGYTDLTPVQEKTFSHIHEGKDLLARAETGSGKTSACAVPLMNAIDPELNAVQVLILVPTRELALQYVDEFARVAKHSRVAPFAVFGGMPMDIQLTKLNHEVHVLVATPGRLIDLLCNSTLVLSSVKTVVLDEADEMLKMGFIDDVNFIMSCILNRHQTLFFSATMPPQIKHLVETYLKDPVWVELNVERLAPESLNHHFLYIGRGDRLRRLQEYLHDETIVQAIIFCNSRIGGEKLHGRLRKSFDSIDFIHGGIEQSRRTSIYNRFKRKKITLMVATDIASRGLDFSHVTHVINYDFPRSHELYTHRTGRTGRMGRKGIAVSLVTDHDLGSVKDVLRINRLQATWHGKEPDLKKLGRGGRQRPGPGRPPSPGRGRRASSGRGRSR